MKISKELLSTIAAGLLLGATVTSCEKSEFFEPSDACTSDCDLDHIHDMNNKSTYNSDNCPACGLG